jgi:hypothetical protein
MSNDNRGVINNPDRQRQIRDYSGLRFGNITPTDIDGLIEYHNKAYVILELKYRETPILRGQELALEIMTTDLYKSGKEVLCIIAKHYEDDCNIPIKAHDSIVFKFRYGQDKYWQLKNYDMKTKDLVSEFLKRVDILKY